MKLLKVKPAIEQEMHLTKEVEEDVVDEEEEQNSETIQLHTLRKRHKIKLKINSICYLEVVQERKKRKSQMK